MSPKFFRHLPSFIWIANYYQHQHECIPLRYPSLHSRTLPLFTATSTQQCPLLPKVLQLLPSIFTLSESHSTTFYYYATSHSLFHYSGKIATFPHLSSAHPHGHATSPLFDTTIDHSGSLAQKLRNYSSRHSLAQNRIL